MFPLLFSSKLAFDESRHRTQDENTADDFRCGSKAEGENSCYNNDKEDADRETILNDQVKGVTKKGCSLFHGIGFAIMP